MQLQGDRVADYRRKMGKPTVDGRIAKALVTQARVQKLNRVRDRAGAEALELLPKERLIPVAATYYSAADGVETTFGATLSPSRIPARLPTTTRSPGARPCEISQ